MSESEPAYDLEYRAKEDDAWYTVAVALSEDRKTLTIMFQGFEAWQLQITSGDFKCVAEVNEFLKRFRPVSKQFQDKECDKVIKPMKVCAALSFNSDDLRFYDAIVEEVEHHEHSITDGEEECSCLFLLCWLHGPMSGISTSVGIADLCAIQVAALDNPKIIFFSNLMKESLPLCSESCKVSKHRPQHVELGNQLPLNEKYSSERSQQDRKVESYCHKRVEETLDLYTQRGSDEDFGGSDPVHSGSCYFVLIDNMEKDLSTSAISQFLLRHTRVSSQAYIFPSILSVQSGAIASYSKEKIKKIYDFLVHPEHLIVSAKGRPWVVHEKVWDGSCRATLGSILSQSQDEVPWPSFKKELEVVHFGTEAYKTAKQLRDLFMDFLNHEQQLYQMLALKEKQILESVKP